MSTLEGHEDHTVESEDERERSAPAEERAMRAREPSAFAREALATPPVMCGGTEWLVDAFDCDAAALRDLTGLRSLAEQLLAELELTALGAPLIHQFGGHAGVTGLYLLSESHLAWHTYPESRLATYNLYCCRERQELDWRRVLRNGLEADRVTVRRVLRGSSGAVLGRAEPEPAVTTREGWRR